MPITLRSDESFAQRHNGPRPEDLPVMLAAVGASTLEEFLARTIPASIRAKNPLHLGPPRSEQELLSDLAAIAAKNTPYRSLLGMGYADTVTPPVILRNVLENPGWYTAYTPYQAEIAQGRLEALLNFQTMIVDLTGMQITNASLLDESTAAAEAMSMFWTVKGHPAGAVFFVSEQCHPQNIALIRTRAKPLGISVKVGDPAAFRFTPEVFGALLQYPGTDGRIEDLAPFCTRAHEAGALVAVAADLLSLALLTPPGEFGADAAVGSSQRFGVPMGYGGPHAGFLATKDEHKRFMPGRIIGMSIDAQNRPALRMALQTREQHIRREKATSNICTAQVLLAVMASMYGVYHGPAGVRRIAQKIHESARILAAGLEEARARDRPQAVLRHAAGPPERTHVPGRPAEGAGEPDQPAPLRRRIGRDHAG